MNIAIIYYKIGEYEKSKKIAKKIEKVMPWDILLLSIFSSINPDDKEIVKKIENIESTKYSSLIKAKKKYKEGKKDESSELISQAIKKDPVFSNIIFVMEKICDDREFIKKIVKKIEISKINPLKVGHLNYYGDFLVLAGFYKEAVKIYKKGGEKFLVEILEEFESKDKNKINSLIKDKLKKSCSDEKRLLYKLSLNLLENKKIGLCDLEPFEKISNKLESYNILFVFSILQNILNKQEKYFIENLKLMIRKNNTPIYFPYIVKTINNCRIIDEEFLPINFWRLDGNFIYNSERLPILFFIVLKKNRNNFLLKNYIKEWKQLIKKEELLSIYE